MQNVMELDMKIFFDFKDATFGVWGLKPGLGQLRPKGRNKPYVWNPGSNSQNKTSFSPES